MISKTICLTGKAGVGKDYAADIIIEELATRGVKAKKYALSSSLKHDASAVLGCDYKDWNDREFKTKNRHVLQNLADWTKDKLGQAYYCQETLQEMNVDEQFYDVSVAVITDCRYDYEVEFFKKNTHLLEVMLIFSVDKVEGDTITHSSERGISAELISVGIVNNKDEEFKERLEKHMNKLVGEK